MAQIYPHIETIAQKHQPATEGEMALLKAFQQYLPDDCQVFFQPYLNGDRPDIVILRKGYGAHIVEVKDWNLEHYIITAEGKWLLKKDNTWIKSPISQVQYYKENLFNLHVENLLDMKIKNQKLFGLVTCSVYFHKATTEQSRNMLKKVEPDAPQNVLKEIQYTNIYGRELLDNLKRNDFIYKSKLSNKSKYFSNEIYDNMIRLMSPPYHYLEEGKAISYSTEQAKLIQSSDKTRQKIRGVAGCGKTLVLAKRAVNAYKRTNSKVLILTFNLTLVNYIHDLINDVREGFPWDAFEILNYHEFFNANANRLNIPIDSLDKYQETSFFEHESNKIKKYKTILIDEAQDYKEEWIRVIIKYFLDVDGEFVVFADEKQNIYNNELDADKKVKMPGIPGAWNDSMNKPYRFSGRILKLVQSFQDKVFSFKYILDNFDLLFQAVLDFGDSAIDYIPLDASSSPEQLFKVINDYLKQNKIHPSDVTVLNSRVVLLRKLDFLIRNNNERTITTFETEEMFDKTRKDINNDVHFKAAIETIRRHKKLHFRMKTGTIKLSTIHSFKGWEIHTAIVLIESEDIQNEFETAELIYTGLTRARMNLLILNLGNAKYDHIIRQAL